MILSYIIWALAFHSCFFCPVMSFAIQVDFMWIQAVICFLHLGHVSFHDAYVVMYVLCFNVLFHGLCTPNEGLIQQNPNVFKPKSPAGRNLKITGIEAALSAHILSPFFTPCFTSYNLIFWERSHKDCILCIGIIITSEFYWRANFEISSFGIVYEWLLTYTYILLYLALLIAHEK